MKKLSICEAALTQEQINAIVNIIVHQCSLISQREKNDRRNYPELYDEDYMRGRRHSFTASVLAGFQKDTVIPNMVITKRKYGRCHCQPELSSDTAVVQLYSYDATLKIDEIKQKCKQFNTPDSKRRFAIFQFFLTNAGHLRQVDLVNFDGEANEVSRRCVFLQKEQVISLSA